MAASLYSYSSLGHVPQSHPPGHHIECSRAECRGLSPARGHLPCRPGQTKGSSEPSVLLLLGSNRQAQQAVGVASDMRLEAEVPATGHGPSHAFWELITFPVGGGSAGPEQGFQRLSV